MPITKGGSHDAAEKNTEVLPPLPGPLESPQLYPGLLAGIARQLVSNTSIILLGLTKEFLQYWFRFPVKMFRPYAVNPYTVFNEMAGQQATWSFIWRTSRKEGFKLLALNVVPLLLANSFVGAVLFNTYTLSHYLLREQSINVPIDAFLSGAIAGATQSFLANPLYRIQRSLEGNSHATHRHKGVVSLYKAAYLKLPAGLPRLGYLYKGIQYNLFRDCVGFSLFFGTFENLSQLGNRAVARLFDVPRHSLQRETRFEHLAERPRPVAIAQGLVTVFSGGMAGAAYQSFVYPLDQLHLSVKLAKSTHPPSHPNTRLDWAVDHVSRNGFRSLYNGMSTALLKAVPASAIGLFVYELSSDYIAQWGSAIKN
ncbi:hypothetical protein HDV03_001081 [Kappamyces sp. JEL0829]|nr:hypothetical protein HDV03_001081 [Kappamyces sp. JEL0829]